MPRRSLFTAVQTIKAPNARFQATCLVEPAYDMLCVLPLRHSMPVASNLSLNKWLTPSASRERFVVSCVVGREGRTQRTSPLVRPIHLSSSFAWHSVQSFFIHLEWKRVAKCENYKGRRNRANLFCPFFAKLESERRPRKTIFPDESWHSFQIRISAGNSRARD